MNRHWRILDFALACLWRQKGRQALILTVYAFVVFVLASVLLLTGALKHEAAVLLAGTPEIIVQKISAGRHASIPLSYGDIIASIRGVEEVTPRYWGYYYDPPSASTYTVMGVDRLPLPNTQLVEGTGYGVEEPLACVIGQGLAEARLLDSGDLLPCKGSDGRLHALRVTDQFVDASSLLTHDLILLRSEAWRRLFSVPPGVATDLVVQVPNDHEAETVITKIVERLPDVRVLGRESLRATYEAVFDWRGGVVLIAFAGALAAFGILASDRAIALSVEEHKNLGILKAIGWDVADVLQLRLWEGAVLSVLAFLTGAVAAHLHVFYLGGLALTPFLQGWSVLFPRLQLTPHGEPLQLFTVFLLAVVPYVLVTLSPSWTAAVRDPEQIMRH